MFLMKLILAIINVLANPFEDALSSTTARGYIMAFAQSDQQSTSIGTSGMASPNMGLHPGYVSDNDGHQGQARHHDVDPPKLVSQLETYCEKDNTSIIRHEHLLYTVIAILLVFIIDKQLLVLPLVALVLAGAALSVDAPGFDFFRIRDPSTYCVEQSSKVEIRYVEVPMVINKEEHIHHHFHQTAFSAKRKNAQEDVPPLKPIFEDAETQTEAIIKPQNTNQETSTAASNYKSNAVQTDAPQPKPKYFDQAVSITETLYKSNGFQTDASITTPKKVDRGVSTTSTGMENASAQTVNGIFVTITQEQADGMAYSEMMRNRKRRAGISPRHRQFEPIQGVEEDVERTEEPQTLGNLREEWLAKFNAYPTMPAPVFGSDATKSDFEYGYRHVAEFVVYEGQQMLNPWGWIETITKNIYISTTWPGAWLFKTGDSEYYRFDWKQGNNIWYCPEHGIGLCLEDTGDITVVRGLDPDLLLGPPIFGKKGYRPGPFYDEAFRGCKKTYTMEHQRQVEEIKRAEAIKRQQKTLEEVRAKNKAKADKEFEEFGKGTFEKKTFDFNSRAW